MTNVFSKIIAGELPSYKIYEDEQIYAFLTKAPLTKGHTLVVPKLEVDHWDDVPEDYFDSMWRASKFVAKMMKERLGCKRVGVMVVGFEVPHAHIHLIPSDSIEDFDLKKAHEATDEELKEAQELLIKGRE